MNKERADQLTVLVLATTFPRWENDTVPQFVYNLSQELTKRGFNVVVLAPHHPGAKHNESLSGINIYRYPYFLPKKYQKLCYGGGILESIKSSFLATFQIPLLVISLLLHTIWIIMKEDIDVINSHWIVPNGIVASFLSRFLGIPHVMSLHAGGVLGLQKLPFHSSISNFVYSESEIILPVSNHIKNNFVSMLDKPKIDIEKKTQIQPMGAYISDYQEYNKETIRMEKGLENKSVGLFVGRIAEKKGIEYLIEAAEKIQETHNSFRLFIVGTGPLEEEIQYLIRKSEAADIIEMTGWVSEEELNRLYTCSDFVFVPSIEAESGDTEGMPTVIAEAFASSNPVIASNVGGIGDVVSDGRNGYLVTQKRPDQIANRTDLLISDKKHQKRLAINALKTAQELDWESCGTTYSNAFSSVLE